LRRKADAEWIHEEFHGQNADQRLNETYPSISTTPAQKSLAGRRCNVLRFTRRRNTSPCRLWSQPHLRKPDQLRCFARATTADERVSSRYCMESSVAGQSLTGWICRPQRAPTFSKQPAIGWKACVSRKPPRRSNTTRQVQRLIWSWFQRLGSSRLRTTGCRLKSGQGLDGRLFF
jgi:hypothetical protein